MPVISLVVIFWPLLTAVAISRIGLPCWVLVVIQ